MFYVQKSIYPPLQKSKRLKDADKMKKITVVALGDSITNGIQADVSEKDTYRHLLQEKLSQETGHDITVINAGVNGDITSTAIHRLKRDVLKYSPDYVTVMFGVNDAGYYRPVTDSMADTPRVTSDDFRRNLELIIEVIRDSGAESILVTPIPMNNNYAHKDFPVYVENGLNFLVDRYANIIRELSSQTGTPLIDVHKAFDINPGTEKFVPDGIHPNKEGHGFIANLFIEKFTKILSDLNKNKVQ